MNETSEDGGGRVLRLRQREVLALAGLYFVYDWLTLYQPGVAAGLAFAQAGAVLALAVVSFRAGLILFVVCLVFADDISRMDTLLEGRAAHTLMTVSAGGVALGNVAPLGLMAVGVIAALARWGRRPPEGGLHFADAAVLLALLVYAISTALGWHFVMANPRGALNDLNLPLMLGGFYLILRLNLIDPDDAPKLLAWIALAIAAKTVVWTVYALTGVGEVFGTTIRVSFESGRILLVFLLVYGLALQDGRIELTRRERLTALALAGLAAFNIFIHAGRMAWVFAAFAVLVLLALGPVREKLRWGVWAAAGGAALLLGALVLRPQIFETLGYYAGTLKFWDPEAAGQSHSSMVRVYEFRNIHAQLADHGRLAFGEGPGSTFTDTYHPFPFGLTEDDYPLGATLARQFEGGHGLLQDLLLNVGYAGTALYLAALLMIYGGAALAYARAGGHGHSSPPPCPPPVATRPYARGRNAQQRVAALMLLAFLPPMMYTAWSAKTNILLGVFAGVTGVLLAGAIGPRRHTPSP